MPTPIEAAAPLRLDQANLSPRSTVHPSPEDWRDQLSIFRGATFNLAHGLDQMLYFRPHNELEDVEGVYLVGGGTHPGSGLPVIYEGARITSDLVLSRWKRSRTEGSAEAISAQAAVTASREVTS